MVWVWGDFTLMFVTLRTFWDASAKKDVSAERWILG